MYQRHITELGLLTLRVHEAVGGSVTCQDIEWAFDGIKFLVLQARPVTSMSEQEFISLISEMRKKYANYGPSYMILSSSASIPFEMMAKILDKDFPGRGYSLANGLMAGASKNMTSAQHGYRLMELAETARKDNAACSYFTAEKFNPSAFRDEIPEESRFMKEFEEFLKEFGHRGVYESEILNPRWSEDPSYLLENIRAQVLSPGNPDLREPGLQQRRLWTKKLRVNSNGVSSG